MEDIRERMSQRDSESSARADRANVFRTTSHTIKRTATDVAAESRCTCGTTAVDCPLRDHAHYVLRRSVPGGAESEAPRVEEFMYMAGQPVDTPAQTAFLEAARMLAPGLPSEKEAVFLALLKEGVCGFLVDDVASLQGVPLSKDVESILMKVGVLLNQRFLYREALKSASDLEAEVRGGPASDRVHVITNLEDSCTWLWNGSRGSIRVRHANGSIRATGPAPSHTGLVSIETGERRVSSATLLRGKGPGPKRVSDTVGCS